MCQHYWKGWIKQWTRVSWWQNPNTQFLVQPSSPGKVRDWWGRLLHRLKSNGRHHLESSSATAKEPVSQRESRQERMQWSGASMERTRRKQGGSSSSINRVRHTRHPAAKPGHGWTPADPRHEWTLASNVGPSPIPLTSLGMLYPAATGIPLADPAVVMQIIVPKKGVRSFTSCSETTSDKW